MSKVLNSANTVIIIEREIIALNKYVKRKYVIGQSYVLHNYPDTSCARRAVLSSIVNQALS